uniref:hypothetical protein n=1 Tax=Paractinoplanes polyasparticus TaxID=2856853 RepID=UPI001C84E84A|nr:hypothetical protein [Actinoplanes polyasparticus]
MTEPSDRSSLSGEYAALLRTGGEEVVQVSRIYLTALTLIRQLVRLDLLRPEERVVEIALVLAGLERVLEEQERRTG